MAKELYIGVMSGTSLDGVDVVLCEIDALTCKLLYSLEYPFKDEVKVEVLALIAQSTTLAQVGKMDVKLGILFAEAINALIQKYQIDPLHVKAIGLHGQTLWHEPNSEFPFSMQLGSANVVSAKTGIKVVSDFRNMDIANGGQGAPFAPAFHRFFFSHVGENIGVLNIGGMANITIFGEKLLGWDIGCGNVLLDIWNQKINATPYDKEGRFAQSGAVNESLLETFLQDEYFLKKPPKSTGREYFNEAWLEKYITHFSKLSAKDIQRTLLELVAQSVANDIVESGIKTLIVCGGGVKNSFLLQRLKEVCKIDVTISDHFGISADFLEAMGFAWLAYMRVHNKEVDLKDVTGASKNSILGGIYG